MQTITRQSRTGALAFAGSTVLLITLLLAAGCTGQAPAGRLDGTEWTLVQYLQNKKTVQALASNPVTLTFGDDKKLAGSAGCNRYFASWERSGSSLVIGQAGSTLMYCGESGVMEQESAYLALLAEVKTFAIDGDRLVLADTSGNAILTFSKTVPPAPLPLTGTNRTLSSVPIPDAVSSVIAGSQVTAAFESGGKMAGSAGCNRYFAGYAANGTSMTISGIGSTKMMCHEPDIMNQESAYLAALESVRGYQITGSTLVLAGSDGSPLLTFSGQP